MGKWWNQAATIDRLTREVEFAVRQKDEIEGLLNREESRSALLEKALITERQAKDKVLLRYADQVSKQVGLPQHFVDDAKPKVEDKPDAELESRVRDAAIVQREQDINSGLDPYPVEWYENQIRSQGLDAIILN